MVGISNKDDASVAASRNDFFQMLRSHPEDFTDEQKIHLIALASEMSKRLQSDEAITEQYPKTTQGRIGMERVIALRSQDERYYLVIVAHNTTRTTSGTSNDESSADVAEIHILDLASNLRAEASFTNTPGCLFTYNREQTPISFEDVARWEMGGAVDSMMLSYETPVSLDEIPTLTSTIANARCDTALTRRCAKHLEREWQTKPVNNRLALPIPTGLQVPTTANNQ